MTAHELATLKVYGVVRPQLANIAEVQALSGMTAHEPAT